MLGALWESSIYRNRAPAGKTLLRVLIGGACDPAAVALDDRELLRVVRDDLATTMRLGCAPEFTRIVRHRRGIPQYAKGHLARLRHVDTLLHAHPGLLLAGNSYRGVSLNACVSEASQIAERVLRQNAESPAA
jgi:oxygen-dependent protoporphyrinogen oxidase